MKNQESPLIPAVEGLAPAQKKSSKWQMWLILFVSAAPVIASYVTFYFIKPTGGQTNYGELVYPVQEAPQELLMPIVYGKWTLILARPASTCEQDESNCVRLLFTMRQVRAALGKERERLQILWIITDNKEPTPRILESYDPTIAGVKTLRLPPNNSSSEMISKWLDMDSKGEKIQLLDPSGSRMMRFPVDHNQPVFKKMHKDIEKLLKWNPTGKHS